MIRLYYEKLLQYIYDYILMYHLIHIRETMHMYLTSYRYLVDNLCAMDSVFFLKQIPKKGNFTM